MATILNNEIQKDTIIVSHGSPISGLIYFLAGSCELNSVPNIAECSITKLNKTKTGKWIVDKDIAGYMKHLGSLKGWDTYQMSSSG
eukprot:UN04244